MTMSCAESYSKSYMTGGESLGLRLVWITSMTRKLKRRFALQNSSVSTV